MIKKYAAHLHVCLILPIPFCCWVQHFCESKRHSTCSWTFSASNLDAAVASATALMMDAACFGLTPPGDKGECQSSRNGWPLMEHYNFSNSSLSAASQPGAQARAEQSSQPLHSFIHSFMSVWSECGQSETYSCHLPGDCAVF